MGRLKIFWSLEFIVLDFWGSMAFLRLILRNIQFSAIARWPATVGKVGRKEHGPFQISWN